MQRKLRKKQAGVSLIELMGTVSIVAVVNAVAIPTFSDTIQRNEIRSHAERVVSTLTLARSEAVKRNQPVSICRSSDGETCDGAWNDGWIVFSNLDGDNSLDSGVDEVIRVYEGLGDNLRFDGTVGDDAMTYFADGSYADGAATVKVCPVEEDGIEHWVVGVNAVGRPRLNRTMSSCG